LKKEKDLMESGTVGTEKAEVLLIIKKTNSTWRGNVNKL